VKHDYLDTDGTTLSFVSLHEHPASGGFSSDVEFPCYDCLSVQDGKVVYSWDVPESPTDVFSDEDPLGFCFLPDKQAAKAKLLDTQKRLQEATEVVQSLLSALETGDYVTVRSSDDE
jgi:hypothetical protein